MTAPSDDDGRRYPGRPFVAASLACVRRGRILIARRVAQPSAGLWSLPGGLIEIGETAKQAAERELFEETGVRCEAMALVDSVDVVRRDAEGRVERHVVILAFAGRWIDGDGVIGPEAAAIAWTTPEEVARLETTPGLPDIAARALARLA